MWKAVLRSICDESLFFPPNGLRPSCPLPAPVAAVTELTKGNECTRADYRGWAKSAPVLSCPVLSLLSCSHTSPAGTSYSLFYFQHLDVTLCDVLETRDKPLSCSPRRLLSRVRLFSAKAAWLCPSAQLAVPIHPEQPNLFQPFPPFVPCFTAATCRSRSSLSPSLTRKASH